MTEQRRRETGCALTGHRFMEKGYDPAPFRERVKYLIEERNVVDFYCGMALGFDTLACKYLLELKKVYPQIRVIACIPCPEQAQKFSVKDREIYEFLVSSCDEKIVLSERYTNTCMHARNRYMVDRASFLLAHCLKEKGGTAYTVAYARRKGVEVFLI